ncbi:MAG: hypothetical protein GY853_01600 [PVC group bacterium]|nr:hypothetical protein [PVC group bacterium]
MIKTQKQLKKRLKQLHNHFQKEVHYKMVEAVSEYLQNNDSLDNSDIQYQVKEIEELTDSLILSGAWLYDRIQGKICTTHNKDYKGSLTKKVRKALGFNI